MFMTKRAWICPTLLFTVVLISPIHGSTADSVFSWKTSEEEAAAMLSRYVQVDTTNPPGNEIKAAQFLKEIFG